VGQQPRLRVRVLRRLGVACERVRSPGLCVLLPSQPPPIHAPGSGGASIHGQSSQTPPKHWALAIPRSTHDGLSTPWHGLYGPACSPEHGASLSVAVQANAEAADQCPQALATDEGDPAPSPGSGLLRKLEKNLE
jgi:hypothetical protein